LFLNFLPEDDDCGLKERVTETRGTKRSERNFFGDHSPVETSWCPYNYLVHWNDTGYRKRVSVIVHLPSGVRSTDVFIHTTDGGKALGLKVQVPQDLYDLGRLATSVSELPTGDKKQFELAMGDTLRIYDAKGDRKPTPAREVFCKIQLNTTVIEDRLIVDTVKFDTRLVHPLIIMVHLETPKKQMGSLADYCEF
jgi:hypothetical protein